VNAPWCDLRTPSECSLRPLTSSELVRWLSLAMHWLPCGPPSPFAHAKADLEVRAPTEMHLPGARASAPAYVSRTDSLPVYTHALRFHADHRRRSDLQKQTWKSALLPRCTSPGRGRPRPLTSSELFRCRFTAMQFDSMRTTATVRTCKSGLGSPRSTRGALPRGAGVHARLRLPNWFDGCLRRCTVIPCGPPSPLAPAKADLEVRAPTEVHLPGRGRPRPLTSPERAAPSPTWRLNPMVPGHASA